MDADMSSTIDIINPKKEAIDLFKLNSKE